MSTSGCMEVVDGALVEIYGVRWDSEKHNVKCVLYVG